MQPTKDVLDRVSERNARWITQERNTFYRRLTADTRFSPPEGLARKIGLLQHMGWLAAEGEFAMGRNTSPPRPNPMNRVKRIPHALAFRLGRLWPKLRWHLYRLSGAKFCRSVYGPVFLANYADNTFRYYILGEYGFFFANFLKTCRDTDVFLDIGANQGLYAILAAQNLTLRRVVAFDPSPATFSRLLANLEKNHVSAKVLAVPKGVSSTAGNSFLTFDPHHTGAANVGITPDESASLLPIELISSQELDAIVGDVSQQRIGIKIDVEGHEPEVFQALRASRLWRSVAWIYFEADERRFDVGSLLLDMKKEGLSEFYRTDLNASHFDVLLAREQIAN